MLRPDRSLEFPEYVIWVVSLNTQFILVYAFCPNHTGHFSLVHLGFEHIQASHFEGLMTTITGYTLLVIKLILYHGLATPVKFHRSRHLLGVSYIAVKVSLISVAEKSVPSHLWLVAGYLFPGNV